MKLLKIVLILLLCLITEIQAADIEDAAKDAKTILALNIPGNRAGFHIASITLRYHIKGLDIIQFYEVNFSAPMQGKELYEPPYYGFLREDHTYIISQKPYSEDMDFSKFKWIKIKEKNS